MSFFKDQILIVALLAVLIFGSLLVIVIVNEVNTAFQNSDIADIGKSVVQDADTKIPEVVDWIVGLLFIGLPLIALGLAFVNYIPSFFYWIAALLAFVMSVVGFIIENLYGSLVSPSVMADAASTIPVTNFFMSNMGFYVIVVWILLAVGTYVKTQNARGVLYG